MSDYGFTWGVRASFLAYIRGLGDGSIELDGGVAYTDDGALFFPFAGLDASEDDSERWIRTQGSALFQGHHGMLTVPLRDLLVRMTRESATLCSVQSDGSVYPIADVALGEPEIGAEGIVWRDAPVMLTEPGSRYFGGNYPEGTPMEPLTIRLPPVG